MENRNRETVAESIEYRIREARPEDLEQAAAIEAAGFPPAEAAGKEDIRRRIETFPESFFVAESEGLLIGFVNGAVSDEIALPDSAYHDLGSHDPEGCCQQIFGLNVLAGYRRQGIGEALMRHMIRSAYIRGKKAVILTCKEHMIPFYTRLGYTLVGRADSTHGGACWYEMRYTFRPYTHTVQYYETDQMGCVHHSNYIRWFEEARTEFLNRLGIGYNLMERTGIVSPVLSVQAEYRAMTRFADTVDIELSLAHYNGIKFTVEYRVADHASGELRCAGSSSHCFLNRDGRPLSLKKTQPGWHEILSACVRK